MQVTVRKRDRRGGRVREGLDYTWTEWQVVNGRYIVSRHDSEGLAEAAAKRFRDRLVEIRDRAQKNSH